MLVSGMNEETAPELRLFTLSNIMVNFLKSCGEDYRTIVLHVNASESIIKSLGELETIAVILQKDLPKIGLNFWRKNKVDLFIVSIENSVHELNEILLDLKTSLWWDNMRPYFVLSSLTNGCKDAKAVLKMVWQQSILSCYYVCFDSQRQLFVYTFNPYSSQAPYQWRMVEEVTNNANYMALYNRPYDEADICNGFNFDRTEQLDMAATKIFVNSDLIFRDDVQLIEAIKSVFNASVIQIRLWDCDPTLEEYQSQKETIDVILCLQNYDILSKLDNLVTTYPMSINGHYIFSNNQRYLSPLEKKYNSFDISMIIVTLVLSIIIYVVILYMTSCRSYSFAVIEILRLWSGFSMTTKIRTQYLRIFFTLVFIYFLVIQNTLQGDLADFLSKTELRQNLNSLEDLQSDNYQKILVTDNGPWSNVTYETILYKIMNVNYSYCIDSVIKDKSKVCLISDHDLMLQIEYKIPSIRALQSFYVSKYAINYVSRAYGSRRDWPLRERFDRFLMSLESFGINGKLIDNQRSHLRITSNLQTSRYTTRFQKLSIDSLLFVFLCWTIGIVSSVISFIFETCMLFNRYYFKLKLVDKNKIVFEDEILMVLDENNKLKVLSFNNNRKITNKIKNRVIVIKRNPANRFIENTFNV